MSSTFSSIAEAVTGKKRLHNCSFLLPSVHGGHCSPVNTRHAVNHYGQESNRAFLPDRSGRMEYLYTEENLKMILASLEQAPKKHRTCPMCARLSGIMDNSTRHRDPSGTRTPQTSGLEEFILIKNSWHILKCPFCSRLYTDEYRYDHLVGGREDECLIAGIDYTEALELLKGIKAKKLTKTGDTWTISF